MTITMQNIERLTLDEMEEFLEGSRSLGFSVKAGQSYGFIERVLKAQGYRRLNRRWKGVVRLFLMKVTGHSRAQLTRLVTRWMRTRKVERKPARRPHFTTRYTSADVALLAAVDAANDDISGPAVRRLFQRAHDVYNDKAYSRLAEISVSHLYNLRRSAAYRKIRVKTHQTRGQKNSIAERRKPDPRGRPGYLRVDTVHQGIQDGKPGLYHINAVDTVTQTQVVGCVEAISERYLVPVLEAMLHQFPFRIQGFHCDNGSEFINHTVAALLNKLLIEFTKSRPYRTTDNALVEGKNGAVIRKHIGYGPIPAEHADSFQKFYVAYLNPYLFFHRPCGFATIYKDARGKRRRVYKVEDYRTPYEKLCSLAGWEKYLKPGITAGMLEHQAGRMTDLEAAQRMQKAKIALLAQSRGTR